MDKNDQQMTQKCSKKLKNAIIYQNIQISTKISAFGEFLDINMTKTQEM